MRDMKKFYLILLGVATLSFATLSCSKEAADPSQQEQSQKEENPKEDTTPENPTGEDDTPVPEGMVRLTFGVSHEGDAPATEPETEDSKTSWDGSTHAWSEGDRIRILWGTGDSDYKDVEIVENKVTLDIKEAVLDEIEFFYAVYPAELSSDFVLNDGTIDFCVRRYQDGTFASANKMVARAAKTSAILAFKNVTHIVKFSLTENNPYDQFEFTSNESSKLLVDVAGVTFDENNNITLVDPATSYTVFGNSHSKYVDLQSGITAGKDYYFAVLPGCNLNTGFGVKARKKGESSYSLGALSKRPVSTDRGVVTNIGNLDPMIHADWFIKEDGTGNGSSWEDAGNLSLFLKLIKDKTNDQGINSTWRLYNAKIHFAEGTYDIYAANEGTLSFNGSAWDMEADEKYQLKDLNLTIDGGYPSSNTGTSLDHKDPVNHPTKWQTAQTDNTYRVFEAADCRMSGWTFDGITFEANGPHILAGDVFHFDKTTSGTVNFNNCYFRDFVQSGTVNGGPILVEGTGAVKISFTSCTFSNNTCNTGGAVYIYNENANVTFDNCLFDSNSAYNYAGALRARSFASLVINGGSFEKNLSNNKGGAIYVDAGKMSISGTSFINNKSVGNRGGAILLASSSESSIKDARFESNSAENGGAIHTEAGTVNISGNTTFSKNSATNGGAIRSSGSVVLNIDNATFTENTATNGGGIAFEYDTGASVNVTNSIFRANSNSAILNKGAMKVVGCVFESNSTGDKGSAICTMGASGKTAIAKIFNSQFEGNESTPTDGSGSSMKGCTVITVSNAYALVANSTFSGNIEHSKSHGVISPGTNTNTKVYVVSSTLSENLFSDGSSTSAGPDFARTTSYLLVYNTISTNTAESIANVVVQNSIFKLRCFKDNRTTYEKLAAFGLGTYSNGVYPLDATYSDAYNKGMEVADIQALTYDGNITLTKEEKDLLANDQKGNERNGTIMGAYVKTKSLTE